jgi:hypothetical protein
MQRVEATIFAAQEPVIFRSRQPNRLLQRNVPITNAKSPATFRSGVEQSGRDNV